VKLTQQQRDRALGVMIGTACGDALGAPLEFGPVVPYSAQIAMTGGGSFGWEPGEWTDDTSMAVVIMGAIAEHGGLDDGALNTVSAGFHDWAKSAPDVGNQTRHVLATARFHGRDAAHLIAVAADFARSNARSDGNGSLMRTAPVALAFLDDPAGLAAAARAVSALTHAGDDSTDAWVLWTSAIRVAVIDGTLQGLRAGLEYIPAERRSLWRERIEAAEHSEPWDFPRNGWVVHAFQAAVAAITCRAEHDGAPADSFERGVDHAVRCGHDTDTVGAIAGGLLGALHGLAAVPTAWTDVINGWPGMRADDLVALTDAIVTDH
jgi:ADP-ribosylglycohydrolase